MIPSSTSYAGWLIVLPLFLLLYRDGKNVRHTRANVALHNSGIALTTGVLLPTYEIRRKRELDVRFHLG
jgi:hypothetical protein